VSAEDTWEWSKRDAAVLLMAADSVMVADHDNAEKALAFARGIAEAVDTDPLWANGRHDGDCTKQPMTCGRCQLERYEEAAQKIWDSEEGVDGFACSR
jgi:hypothetical protein